MASVFKNIADQNGLTLMIRKKPTRKLWYNTGEKTMNLHELS